MSSLLVPLTLSLIALLPICHAHGAVTTIIAGNISYPGASSQRIYSANKPEQAGWYAYNQDNGYVAPSEYNNNNITCHKSATPGSTFIPVSTALEFFKIDELGLLDDATPPGIRATDNLIAKNFTWTVKIPSNIAPGSFVLRHGIVALHSAGQADGTQSYPTCFSLQVTGSGNAYPCTSGAVCKKGTELYTSTDAGIFVEIYSALSRSSSMGQEGGETRHLAMREGKPDHEGCEASLSYMKRMVER